MKTNDEKREYLNSIWESITPDSISFFNVSFTAVAPKLVEFLVVSILHEDSFEVGYGNLYCSVISYDVHSDKLLEIRLRRNNCFELYLKIVDWEQEHFEYNYNLNETDLKLIPDGLKTIMNKVLINRKAETIRSGMIN